MPDDEAVTRLTHEEREAVFGKAGKWGLWPWYVAVVVGVGAATVAGWASITACRRDHRQRLLADEQQARTRTIEERRIGLEAALVATREKKSALDSAFGNANNEADRGRFEQELQTESAKEEGLVAQLRLLRPESPAYAGSCVPGALRCAGDVDQVCGPTGRWEPGAACSKSRVCRGGECVLACQCAPGDPFCSCLQVKE